jgi:chitodextrinase
MSARNGAWATAALALALTFTTAAVAGQPKSSAPKAPTNLRITASTATSVSLAWDAASSSSSSWWYCVQSSGAGCFRVDPPKTTFTHPLLWPGSTYTFTVVVVASNGNRSAPSNAVTFRTPPDTTPPSAPALSTTSVVPTRVSLTWTRSVDNATQVSYSLLMDGSPYLGPQIGLNGLTIPYLQPSSAHTFKVIARDSFGNAAESNLLTVTTPAATDSSPPTAPANLRFSSETSPPEAWLDWDAASDPGGDAPGLLLYEVYVNGARASTGIGNVEDVVYCTANGPNTIAVRAIDTSGNASPFSNELVFTC